jgi:spore germination protein
MIIHIVQEGDTVESISKLYNLPRSRIEADNYLPVNYSLNPGQAIMIVPPSETHVIDDGDTLSSIAESYGVTQLQLLRNNPQLSDSSILNIGEELVIRYPVENKINVFGYSTIYISTSVLRKTLPYLTYLTIFSYKVDVKGTFSDINDTEIII